MVAIRFRTNSMLTALSGWPRRVAALICLILAAAAALIGPEPGRADSIERTASVLIAARGLTAGSVLAATDVRLSSWPISLVPAGTITNRKDAIGRTIGAAMARGEPMTVSRLLDTSIASALTAGQVAVTITLRDGGQGAILAPGARIDLYGASDSLLIADGKPLTSSASSGRQLATAARVLAVVAQPQSSGGGLTIVVATDRSAAARLANQPTDTLLATLRPSR
jgi:pilus assembly protein CpaB